MQNHGNYNIKQYK